MATTYGQFCPVAMASEVLTERWTPLVVRELLCGSTRFNDLRRGVPLMSPALLSKRLKTLERVGVVDHVGGEYQLTDALQELIATEPVHGVVFRGRRYDTGDRLDYLKAVVQLAADREDLGPPLTAWLREWLGSRP